VVTTDFRIFNLLLSWRSKNSSVTTLVRLQARQPEFNSWQGHGLFFNTASRTALWPTQPPTPQIPDSFSRYKSGWGMKLTTQLCLVLQFRNMWSYSTIPPYVFMVWYLIKHRIHLHGIVLNYILGQLHLIFITKYLLKPFSN